MNTGRHLCLYPPDTQIIYVLYSVQKRKKHLLTRGTREVNDQRSIILLYSLQAKYRHRVLTFYMQCIDFSFMKCCLYGEQTRALGSDPLRFHKSDPDACSKREEHREVGSVLGVTINKSRKCAKHGQIQMWLHTLEFLSSAH